MGRVVSGVVPGCEPRHLSVEGVAASKGSKLHGRATNVFLKPLYWHKPGALTPRITSPDPKQGNQIVPCAQAPDLTGESG